MKQDQILKKNIRKVVKQLIEENFQSLSPLNCYFAGKRICTYPAFWDELKSVLVEKKSVAPEVILVLRGIGEVSARKTGLLKNLETDISKISTYLREDILRHAAAAHELCVLRTQIPLLRSKFMPCFDKFGTTAFNKIITQIGLEPKKETLPITREGIFDLLQAWELAFQLEYLNEMEDALINGPYYLDFSDDPMAIKLINPEKSEITSDLKEYYRKSVLARLSKGDVSKEELFKKHDKDFHSDLGRATVLVSGATISGLPPGTTALTVENITSTDVDGNLILSPEAQIKMTMNSLVYNYRIQLQKHYVPKDEDLIKKLFVEIPELDKEHIPVHVIISIGCWLTAIAGVVREDLLLTNDSLIPDLLERHRVFNKIVEPVSVEKQSEIILDFLDIYKKLISQKSKIKLQDNLIILSENELLPWLQGNEDLKDILTDQKLLSLLRFMAKSNFPGLFYDGAKYYLMPRVLNEYDSLSHFYNHVVLKYLYQDREDRKYEVADNHAKREEILCSSLVKLFTDRAFLAKNNIDFKYGNINSGDLRGQFDVIAVDPIQKIVLTIEVKLKNTPVTSRAQKEKWIDEKILGLNPQKVRGAIQQVDGYIKYFRQSDCGEALVKNIFDIDSLDGYKIIPLIVTDNFLIDHEQIEIPTYPGEFVSIISFLELKALLQSIEPFEEKYPDWGIYHLNRILTKYPDNIEAKELLTKIHPLSAQISKETIEFIEKHKVPFWDSDKINLQDLLDALESNKYWNFLNWFPNRLKAIATTRFEKNIRMEY